MSDEDDIPQEALLAQVAALPYRMSSGEIEVLLITSRDSGRWLIPKGWLMKRRSGSEAAAVEAFEEAGIRGAVATSPLGAYTYQKTMKDGAAAAYVALRAAGYGRAALYDGSMREWLADSALPVEVG